MDGIETQGISCINVCLGIIDQEALGGGIIYFIQKQVEDGGIRFDQLDLA